MEMLQTAFSCHQGEIYLFPFVLLIQMLISKKKLCVCLWLLSSRNVFTGTLRITLTFYIPTFELKIHTMKMEEWPAPIILYLSDLQYYQKGRDSNFKNVMFSLIMTS